MIGSSIPAEREPDGPLKRAPATFRSFLREPFLFGSSLLIGFGFSFAFDFIVGLMTIPFIDWTIDYGPQPRADAIRLEAMRSILNGGEILLTAGVVVLIVGIVVAMFGVRLARVFTLIASIVIGGSIGTVAPLALKHSQILFPPPPPPPPPGSVVLHVAVPPDVANRLVPGASATVVDRAVSGLHSSTAPCATGCTFTIDAPSGANDFDVTLAGISTGRVVSTVNAGGANNISTTFGSTVASIRLPHLTSAAGTAVTFDASPTILAPDGSIVLAPQPWRDAEGRALTVTFAQASSSGGATLRAVDAQQVGGAGERYELAYDGSAHSTCVWRATTSTGMSVEDGSFASLSGDPSSSEAFFQQTTAITDGPDKTFWVIADNNVVTLPNHRYPYAPPGVVPKGAVVGPDGYVWIALGGHTNAIERVAYDFSGKTFTDRRFRGLRGIAVGPDGNLWVADHDNSSIDRVTRSGRVTVYSTATNARSAPDQPDHVTFGADGKLYYINDADGAIDAFDTKAAAHVEFALPGGAVATGIARGADGNMWFIGTDKRGGVLGRLAPNGTVSASALGPGIDPTSIVGGADGNIWFSDRSFGLRWVTPSGEMGSYAAAGGGIDDLYASYDGSFWVRTYPDRDQIVSVRRYAF
jgi:streptogramin lyase